MSRPYAIINVNAVRTITHGVEVSFQISEELVNQRCCSPVGCVDTDTNAFQIARNSRLQELQILDGPFWELINGPKTVGTWPWQGIFWRIN